MALLACCCACGLGVVFAACRPAACLLVTRPAGFRVSPALPAAFCRTLPGGINGAVGGSKTSAHRFGSAADIDAAGISNLQLARDIIQMRDDGEITFDQLIYEFPERGESGWVHFGCRHNSAERNQILTATKRGNGGKTQYLFGLHP